jgi:hypothetical protein
VVVLMKKVARRIEPDGRVHGGEHLERDHGPELLVA